MSKVITFSRQFPSYHPRKGEPTYFVEKFWTSYEQIGLPDFPLSFAVGLDVEAKRFISDDFPPKHHTIRAGHRFKAGDWFSPRVWSGKPYNSKQIQFAPDIQIKKTHSFSIGLAAIYVDQQRWIDKSFIAKVACNDGLDVEDFLDWFQYPKPFTGQIICWNDQIEY